MIIAEHRIFPSFSQLWRHESQLITCLLLLFSWARALLAIYCNTTYEFNLQMKIAGDRKCDSKSIVHLRTKTSRINCSASSVYLWFQRQLGEDDHGRSWHYRRPLKSVFETNGSTVRVGVELSLFCLSASSLPSAVEAPRLEYHLPGQRLLPFYLLSLQVTLFPRSSVHLCWIWTRYFIQQWPFPFSLLIQKCIGQLICSTDYTHGTSDKYRGESFFFCFVLFWFALNSSGGFRSTIVIWTIPPCLFFHYSTGPISFANECG